MIDHPKGQGMHLVLTEKWKIILQKAILILHDVINFYQLIYHSLLILRAKYILS